MRVRGRRDQPTLITSAPMNPDDEFDRRRRKYAIMMALRAVCVVAAALTYRISPWLAVAFVVGGAALPWCAVLIANERPAKRRGPVVGPRIVRTERALPGHSDRTVEPGPEWHNPDS